MLIFSVFQNALSRGKLLPNAATPPPQFCSRKKGHKSSLWVKPPRPWEQLEGKPLPNTGHYCLSRHGNMAAVGTRSQKPINGKKDSPSQALRHGCFLPRQVLLGCCSPKFDDVPFTCSLFWAIPVVCTQFDGDSCLSVYPLLAVCSFIFACHTCNKLIHSKLKVRLAQVILWTLAPLPKAP